MDGGARSWYNNRSRPMTGQDHTARLTLAAPAATGRTYAFSYRVWRFS
jgi:hypothetical protein